MFASLLREEKFFSQRTFSIYTDIRKLQDKAKTSYTLSDCVKVLSQQNDLSQDELAEKLYVTRQAVSRWENGETISNTETLKLLSGFFDVSINTFLGTPRKLIC